MSEGATPDSQKQQPSRVIPAEAAGTPSAQLARVIRRSTKRTVQAIGKRSSVFRSFSNAAVNLKRKSNWAKHLRRTHVDDKTIVFESFMGRSYSCSPKAIYKAMLADPAYDDFTFIWAFRMPDLYADNPELERATLVRYHSQPFYEALARAHFWVTNSVLPTHLTPRVDQVLIQTWHGTPFKRLGCDILESSSANALYSARDIQARYRREGARLTWLLSPSRYATERFTSAFDLASTGRTSAIVEEGYPRNDMLSSFSADDVSRVKSLLGIDPAKKVILYAPTWRDNQHVVGIGYTLELSVDFDHLRKELGDDYVVLFRAHYYVANEFDFERYAGFVYDVSTVDDINDLYIVSDMLVTDYSSVFFDYGNLGRPIIFHMYDLDDYTEDIRGFYLDLADLPGPVVRSEAELVSAIRAAEHPDQASIDRRQRFNDTFTNLDDGHASERVLARCIAPVVYHKPNETPNPPRETNRP